MKTGLRMLIAPSMGFWCPSSSKHWNYSLSSTGSRKSRRSFFFIWNLFQTNIDYILSFGRANMLIRHKDTQLLSQLHVYMNTFMFDWMLAWWTPWLGAWTLSYLDTIRNCPFLFLSPAYIISLRLYVMKSINDKVHIRSVSP